MMLLRRWNMPRRGAAAIAELVRLPGAIAVAVLVLGLVASLAVLTLGRSADAQGWWPPWGEEREPVYRQPPRPAAPIERVKPIPTPSYGSGYAGNRPQICIQLEQRLALEANRGSDRASWLPRIESDMRRASIEVRRAERNLERRSCYDWFFFQKTLRNTRRCRQLAGTLANARQRLADLEYQHQQLLNSNSPSLRDALVRELARNNCGSAYERQARQQRRGPFASLWEDGDSTWGGNRYNGVPYATYRTICVRLCDGYFFPVSFSTLPNYFDRDQDLCQRKCAAPAELFYYQNPGASMDQAQSHKTKLAYTSLPTAYRYRKEYVQGCSCKLSEFKPDVAEPKVGGRPGERRAEARPARRPRPPVATRSWMPQERPQ